MDPIALLTAFISALTAVTGALVAVSKVLWSRQVKATRDCLERSNKLESKITSMDVKIETMAEKNVELRIDLVKASLPCEAQFCPKRQIIHHAPLTEKTESQD